MPFIDAKVTVSLADAQKEALKAAFGKAIPTLHKTETYLMVGIQDNYDLWMAGQKLTRCAYVSVSLYGSASPADYSAMTGEICSILEDQLGIPGNGVYVTHPPVSDWGCDGRNVGVHTAKPPVLTGIRTGEDGELFYALDWPWNQQCPGAAPRKGGIRSGAPICRTDLALPDYSAPA